MKDHVSIHGTVKEMTAKMDSGINIPIPSDVNIDELMDGDKSPMFVTIEAVHEGVSKNKRHYSKETIMEIARQVKSKRPDAYLGHLSEEERATKRPTSQTIWLGSVVKKVNGKLRLFVKGYVLPYAKDLRTYLKKAKASGKQVAVSVYGQAKQTWSDTLKAYDMSEFNLESIDWARSGSEGLTPSTKFSITAEMKQDISNREDIIGKMTVGELQEFNPSIIKAIKDEAHIKDVSEMETSVDSELSSIKEMIGDNPTKEIKKLQRTVAEQIIDSSLQSKVKNKTVRTMVKSMIVREMIDMTPNEAKLKTKEVLHSSEVQDIIREIAGNKKINSFKDNRKEGNSRSYTVVK